MENWKNDAGYLSKTFGIVAPEARSYVDPAWKFDFGTAMDAQPSLVTTPSNGIPAYLSTMMDPTLVQTIITPTRAAEIYGEAKKGDWTNLTTIFGMIEHTGYTSSYGDFSQDGQTGANVQFPQRQSYHFQTWCEVGDREQDMMGLARINWWNQKQISSQIILNKASNLGYLFGVAGLQNYGALNDPRLPAPIAPTIKTGTSTAWSSTTDPVAVYNDFIKLYTDLNTRLGGNLTMDVPITVVLPNTVGPVMLYANQFGNTLEGMLKKAFPNMRIEYLPEAATPAGNLMQMFIREFEGQVSVTTAFTEKYRQHRMELYSSNYRQKVSQGIWGAIIYRPVCFAQMLGI